MKFTRFEKVFYGSLKKNCMHPVDVNPLRENVVNRFLRNLIL